MAKLAVFASGSGSNFEAIARRIGLSRHKICCMICDRRSTGAFERADRLGIPAYYVCYKGRERGEAEAEISRVVDESGADLIALAGFMRLLTPAFIDSYQDRIINIHPSLLPKYPGTQGIADSFNSEDPELGITIHRVDYGLDTGPIIMQKSFKRRGDEPLEEIESEIHKLEHTWYPAALIEILDSIA